MAIAPSVSLQDITPFAVDAINQGYVVVLPSNVLYTMEDTPRGQLHALEVHFRQHGVTRGAVDAMSIASLRRVLIWCNTTYFELLGEHAESVRVRVRMIQMHGPDSEEAQRFRDDELPLPDTPLMVLRCDATGARR